MSGRVMPSRTVFVSGNCDVLHGGQLRLLRFARECGERLIVAVNSDRIAGNAAHVPELLRLEGVQSNSWVDEAFVTDTAVTEVIARLRPDVVVKGKENEARLNPGLAPREQNGGGFLVKSCEAEVLVLGLTPKEVFRKKLR